MSTRFEDTVIDRMDAEPYGLSFAVNYPFTCGCWINLAAVGSVTRAVWSIHGSAANTGWSLTMSSTEICRFSDDLSVTTASLATALVAGTWNYILCRGISTANRRISALYERGILEHAQDTTDDGGQTTCAQFVIGADAAASLDWSGMVDEFFVCKGDIQPTDATTDPALLRQIARHGPCSVPRIRDNLYMYYSMTQAEDQLTRHIGTTWTNTGENYGRMFFFELGGNARKCGIAPPYRRFDAATPWDYSRRVIV